MKHDRTDQNIKRAFQQLREQDEMRTPAFTKLWHAAISGNEQPRAGFAVPRIAIAAVMATVILVGGLIYLNSQPNRQTKSISEWRSPTTRLLSFNSGSRGLSVPRIIPNTLRSQLIYQGSGWRSPTAALARHYKE